MRLRSLRAHAAWLVFGAALVPFDAARAAGPFGIDHRIAYDDSGIWSRSIQKDLAVGTALTVIGGAVWFGDDTRIGDTLWRSLDSIVLAAATTTSAKFVFSRERPSTTADPNRFFTGHGNQSFPSGEVAEIAGAVTPVIVEYGPDHPWIYGLAALPVYDAIARVKVRGHWQSDVIAGAAIGVGFGIWSARRESPLVVGFLPHGVTVGFTRHFD